MSLTVLLGGVRSGKTALALDLATRRGGQVTYLATAPHIDGDADLAARIERHRSERPDEWTTVEEELDLEGALGPARSGTVIVDCLTVWVSNLIHHGRFDDEIDALSRRVAAAAAASDVTVIAVSNEVGMGVHPTTEVGRRYRDLLGRVNQVFVEAADTALLLVAGRATPLRDPHDLLPHTSPAT